MAIQKYNLTKTKEELIDFCNKNGYATTMLMEAGKDYVASRCLILNTLSSGFPLFSLSVEKMLKAMFYLTTGTKVDFKNKRDLHNPFLIKKELTKYRDFGLDKHDELLKSIYGHYQSRYFDNGDRSKSKNMNELKEFDNLWYELFQKIDLPLEIKYRNHFASCLLEKDDSRFYENFKFWCLNSNEPFLSHIEEMENMYNAVTDRL